MNLTGKTVAQKPPKVKPDPDYLDRVRGLPCAACYAPPPSEAHHCRDIPDYVDRGLYDRLPGAGLKSGDRDAIPLCADCHRLFHLHRADFHASYGRDYQFIFETRAAIDATKYEDLEF